MHLVQRPAAACPPTPASHAEKLRDAEQNEALLRAIYRRKYTRGARLFLTLQSVFCLALMTLWIRQGHYLAGPVCAVNIWGLLCLAIPGVDLFLATDRKALAEAEDALLRARNAGATLHKGASSDDGFAGRWQHSRK